MIIVIGLATFTGAEAIVEYLLRIDPGNLVRMATGAISGFFIGVMINLGVTGLISNEVENHQR